MTGDTPRSTLSRSRVLEAAIEFADHNGMEAFTIRKLAAALGVGPMTIYHYVPSKEEIIDGMVDIVFSEIDLPPIDQDWKRAIRKRCISARQVLNRHPWASPFMESRTSPGAAMLGHHEAVLGCFRRGGLSLQMTAHAYAILDSYVYGFALEEASLPAGGGEGMAEAAEDVARAFNADEYPYLLELTVEHVLQPGYNFGASFEFGLDLIIDGIDEASRRTAPPSNR